MTTEHKTVFISYRRSASEYAARAIFNELKSRGYDVFMDVASIDSGTFDSIILRQIEARAHFLILLAPGSLERLHETDDWLRREIEHAIDYRRNIVPVLLSKFEFDPETRKHFTGKLADIPRLNALEAPNTYFDEAMNRLCDRYLKQPLEGDLIQPPASDAVAVADKIAEAEAQPAPTENELAAEEWFNQGYLKVETGDYAGTITDWTEAIRLKPDYAEAYNNRGGIWYSLSDYQAAIADSTEFIRLKPDHPGAYNNRGEAYFAFERFQDALTDFQKSNTLRPNFNFAIAGLAITHHALGNRGEARRLWRQLLEMDARYADVEWVKQELDWADSLAREAELLIKGLG